MNRWFLLFVLALAAIFVGTRLHDLFGEPFPPGTLATVRPQHVNRLSGVQKANFHAEDGRNDRLPEGIEVRVLNFPPVKRRSVLATPERVRVQVLIGARKGDIGYMAREDLGPPPETRRRSTR